MNKCPMSRFGLSIAGCFAVLAITTGQALAAPKNSANLGISMTDSPDPVVQGSELTYSITVTNAGPATAANVQVYDDLLSADVVSVSASQGSCESGVVCNLGDVAKGSSASVTIVVRPASTGTLTNTAEVSSDNPGQNVNDDTVTVTTTVEPDPNAPVASCTGTADPVSGLRSYNSGSCGQDFALGQADQLQLRLLPGPDFTGALHAWVYNVPYYTVAGEVSGYFVNGLLVSGSADSMVNAAGGEFRLAVGAGGPEEVARPRPEVCGIIWPVNVSRVCNSAKVPTVGLFGATVTRAPD